MYMRVLPPNEAKKRARANLADWKRQKTIKAAKGRTEPDEPTKEDIQGQSKQSSVKGQAELGMQLIISVEEGDPKRIKELLEKGADVNARDSGGWTPLLWASRFGNTEIAKLLLRRGADVNAKANNGITALWYAMNCYRGGGNYEMAALLRRHGAKV